MGRWRGRKSASAWWRYTLSALLGLERSKGMCTGFSSAIHRHTCWPLSVNRRQLMAEEGTGVGSQHTATAAEAWAAQRSGRQAVTVTERDVVCRACWCWDESGRCGCAWRRGQSSSSTMGLLHGHSGPRYVPYPPLCPAHARRAVRRTHSTHSHTRRHDGHMQDTCRRAHNRHAAATTHHYYPSTATAQPSLAYTPGPASIHLPSSLSPPLFPSPPLSP